MKVRFTRRATRQLDAVLEHLGHRSPKGRVSVAKRVSRAIIVLSDHPLIGRQTARLRVHRIALVPYPYVIDYRLDEDAIVILGIRYTSRRPIP